MCNTFYQAVGPFDYINVMLQKCINVLNVMIIDIGKGIFILKTTCYLNSV